MIVLFTCRLYSAYFTQMIICFPKILLPISRLGKEKKRQVQGYHSPPSIRDEWLTINDQKNNILASLCHASYLAANWLQKLKTKHCLLHRSYFCSYVCVQYLSLIYL